METKARFLFTSLLLTWVLSVGGKEVTDEISCNFPAIYNFGDSNSDTGGIAAAFYQMAPQCGETFFHRQSGRGCDGRLLIDFIGNFLLLELQMPFLLVQKLTTLRLDVYYG